jgi:ribokinase
VLVLGDLVLDIVVVPAAATARGSDTPASVRFRRGGSAGNTAAAIARLGGDATFVGAIGQDSLGRNLASALRADGVRCHVVNVASPTARLVVLLGPGGERSFLTDRGAADALTARDLRPAWFRGTACVHLPAYALLAEPLRAAAVRAAGLGRGHGAAVSVDLASRAPLARIGRREARARVVELGPDVLFGTEGEAAAVAGTDEALSELAPLVVVKAGAAGCRILARGKRGLVSLDVATKRIATTDSTGAGDAFAAGFLLSWLPERELSGPALRRAAQAGHGAAAALLREPRAELGL